MPAASSKKLPPKKCPVCGDAIWANWDNVPTSPLKRYEAHMNANHPAFEKWNDRMNATYFIAIVPFLGLLVLAAMATSAITASRLAISAFPAGLSTIIMILMFQHRGKVRFRRLWIQEHGRPVD